MKERCTDDKFLKEWLGKVAKDWYDRRAELDIGWLAFAKDAKGARLEGEADK